MPTRWATIRRWARSRACISLILLCAACPPATAAEVAIACSAPRLEDTGQDHTGQDHIGQDHIGPADTACRAGARAWAAATGNTVRIVPAPESSTERLALYQRFLAGGDGDIDVYAVDATWPGPLGRYFIDLAPYVNDARRAEYAPALLANDSVDGRLVALPWFADAGVLFYRRDLLERHGLRVPATWAQLEHAAALVQQAQRDAGNPRFWGFVWQGRAGEGLTCNALEWIGSFGGGRIVDGAGRVDLDNARAVAALKMAQGWVGSISPPEVLSYDEAAARGVFQSGNAAFMRDWPSAWALAQGADSAVRGLVGVAPLPRHGAHGHASGVLGGWQLAVAKSSRVPQAAVSLVLYLTSRAEQKRRAIAYSFRPAMPALYGDAEVLKAAPFLGALREVFAHAVARPSAQTKDHYNEVSADFRTTVHHVLDGAPAEPALRALSARLRRLSRGGRW